MPVIIFVSRCSGFCLYCLESSLVSFHMKKPNAATTKDKIVKGSTRIHGVKWRGQAKASNNKHDYLSLRLSMQSSLYFARTSISLLLRIRQPLFSSRSAFDFCIQFFDCLFFGFALSHVLFYLRF